MDSFISALIKSWNHEAMEDIFWLWEDFDEGGGPTWPRLGEMLRRSGVCICVSMCKGVAGRVVGNIYSFFVLIVSFNESSNSYVNTGS